MLRSPTRTTGWSSASSTRIGLVITMSSRGAEELFLSRCFVGRKHAASQAPIQFQLDSVYRPLGLLQPVVKLFRLAGNCRLLKAGGIARHPLRPEHQAAASHVMCFGPYVFHLAGLHAGAQGTQRLPRVGEVVTVDRGESRGIARHGMAELLEHRLRQLCLFLRHWTLPSL